ncbi:MAG: hypothetical protein JSV80_17725 [Acidobacteriota bacterium]|nr:MAG: hypothetical protein JSV80_17725 [Acidobacteriota bacterium]
MRRRLGNQQRGSALPVVLMVLALLSVIGLAFLGTMELESVLSQNNSALQESLAAADAGIQAAMVAALYDHDNDPAGWLNNLFLVSPLSNGHCRPGSTLDPDGSATGVPGSCYVTLLDHAGQPGIPSNERFPIPSAALPPGTDLNFGGYQVELRNVPNGVGGFEPDLLKIVATGSSEARLAGERGWRRSNKAIEAGVEVLVDGLLNNALIFNEAPTGVPFTASQLVHGSVHVFNWQIGSNPPLPANDTAVTFSGASGMRNNYDGVSATLQTAIAPLFSTPQSLDAKLAVKMGDIAIESSQARLGEEDLPNNGLKELLTGIYKQGDFVGSAGDNHWQDDIGPYSSNFPAGTSTPNFIDFSQNAGFEDPYSRSSWDDYRDWLQGEDAPNAGCTRPEGCSAFALDVRIFGIMVLDSTGCPLGYASQGLMDLLRARSPEVVAYNTNNEPAGTEMAIIIEMEHGADIIGSPGQTLVALPPGAPAPSGDTDVTFALVKKLPPSYTAGGYDQIVHAFVYLPGNHTPNATMVDLLNQVIGQMNASSVMRSHRPIPELGTQLPLSETDARLFLTGATMLSTSFALGKLEGPPCHSIMYYGRGTLVAENRTGTMRIEYRTNLLPDHARGRRFPCDDVFATVSHGDIRLGNAMKAAAVAYATGRMIFGSDSEFAGAAYFRELVAGVDDVRFVQTPSLVRNHCEPPFAPPLPTWRRVRVTSWNELE